MKRPILYAAVIGLTAASLAIYADWLVIMAFMIISASLWWFLNAFKRPLIYFFIVIIFPIIIYRVDIESKKQTAFGEGYAFFEGKVNYVVKSEDNYRLYIKNADISSVTGNGKAVISSVTGNGKAVISSVMGKGKTDISHAAEKGKADIIVYCSREIIWGETIRGSGKLTTFDENTNYGGFNYRKYYISTGYQYKCSAENIEKIKNTSWFSRKLYELRNRLIYIFASVFEEENAGVIDSIIVGDRTFIDVGLSEMYRKSGISHILAISGLHISLVGMTLYRILKRFLSLIISAIISCFTIFSYLILTGNGISSRRAVIMFCLIIIADVIGRTVDMETSLGLAAIILIYDNPFVIWNSGFLLSFCAVMGIVYVCPIFSNDKYFLFCKKDKLRVKGNGNFLINSLISSLSVTIATLPLILCTFYELPLTGIFLNIIVIPLMALLMVSAILSGLIGMFSIEAGVFLAGAANYILDFYKWLCGVCMDFKYRAICTGKPPNCVMVVYVIILAVWVCIYHERLYIKFEKHMSEINLILAVAMLIVIFNMRYIFSSGMTISMLDVGQGDSLLVHTDNGVNILIDGGSSSKDSDDIITDYLKYCGVTRLDYILVSHMDEDHINGIVKMLEADCEVTVGKIVLPQNTKNVSDEVLVREAARKGIKVCYAARGFLINAGNCSIEYVHPCSSYLRKSQDINDLSAVYLLKYGKFKMLFMGDAGIEAENCMLQDIKNIQNIDVLKVGHHGSKNSSGDSFVSHIKPRIALISCGRRNRYGHPHADILERLENAGAKILRTDESGAIIITVKGGKVKVKEFEK